MLMVSNEVDLISYRSQKEEWSSVLASVGTLPVYKVPNDIDLITDVRNTVWAECEKGAVVR